jgi:tRNA A37 threonylcarbamoyladenosine synthetase subunit TsaC/SUA5/YrdC|tara:strand:+ start:80 stop:442 length:363 start_codon:yes stop_codon:yes gene_type:complete
MATPKFSAVSKPPIGEEFPFGLTLVLDQITENVQSLTGQNKNNLSSRIVARGDIEDIVDMPTQQLVQTTAKAAGVTISGQDVPTHADYLKLVTDVNQLAADVLDTRNKLNQILNAMKGVG